MPTVLRAVLIASLCAGAVAQQFDGDAFVRAHCVECHGGDATKAGLDLTRAEPDPVAAAWRWSRLRDRVLAGEMPPPDAEPLPAGAARAFADHVAARLRREVPLLPVDPGRVTVRRLSRVQWQRVVHDLFGVHVDTSGFPADDLGYGFDTIGDALTFSTLHLEKHLAAACAVAAAVFDGEDPDRPTVRRFEAEAMQLVDGRGADQGGEIANLYTRATIEQAVVLPRDGVYELRVFAGADQAGDEPAQMVLSRDGRELVVHEVPERRPRVFALRTPLAGGEHRFGLSFVNDFYQPENPDPQRRDRNLRIDWFEITGPTDARPVPPQRHWLAPALAAGDDAAVLRAVARGLLPRVWRRAASRDELARSERLGRAVLQDGGDRTDALRAMLQAALVSPHFLFRIEAGGTDGRAGAVVPLDGTSLAQRLSFFLWGSAPDDALRERAAAGALATTSGRAAEVDRLLADPRADALATDFAAQWLELRSLADCAPDPARFGAFGEDLRASLRRETELLFTAVLREERDVRELLDCDFTHVDARLAAFYGLELPDDGVDPDDFVRVVLPAALRERGGVLGHGSVLAVTSNPTRTSPVKRGKWVLENLLGQGPPPPPPGNDSLPDERAVDSTRSFREQLAQHRERSSCAVCHVRMDAIGFAFERYDAVGRHRERDAGGAIDCSGELPDGRRIEGLAGLKRVLRDDPAFVRTLATKLFVHAVGRDARPADRLRLAAGVDELLLLGPVTLRDLVLLVVQDPAFTHRLVVGER